MTGKSDTMTTYTEVLDNYTHLENHAASGIKQYRKFTRVTKCTGSNGGYQLGVQLETFPFDVVGRTCSAICGLGNS